MSSADDQPMIAGETTITFFDQVKAFYWSTPRLWWLMAICFAVIYLTSFARGAKDDDDTFFSPTVLVGLCIVFWVGLIGFGYWRMSREQRHVRYCVSPDHVELRDGTGSAARLPWSVIKRAAETRSLFLLRVRPAGLRWLPKRAFGADDVAALRAVIAGQLGTNAKLRQEK